MFGGYVREEIEAAVSYAVWWDVTATVHALVRQDLDHNLLGLFDEEINQFVLTQIEDIGFNT